MYETEINGNVLIYDYYYKKTIREQQNCHYNHYLKLQNLQTNMQKDISTLSSFIATLKERYKNSPVAFLIWLTHDHS